MKKIFFTILILSSFLFSGQFAINSIQKQMLKDTLEKLYDKDADIVNDLLYNANSESGWQSSEYKYLYKMKTTNGDKLAIFIITDIYNQNNSLVKKLNMKKNFIILVNVNANPKVVWSGYLNHDTSNKLIGIDVSKLNGYINWEAVKSEGISFAYVRATQGYASSDWSESNAFDNKFIENMNSAIKNNILVGAYHVVYPNVNKGNSEAIKEANYFISKIKAYYKNYKLLPPMIDFEKSSSYYSKQTLTDWVKTFAEEIESQLGIKPIIYMNEFYSDSKVYLNQLPYKLWIAKYKVGTNINTIEELENEYPSFKPNKDYLFWQFTETASDISGISSTFVDKDLFNGSINDLKKILVQASISYFLDLPYKGTYKVTQGNNGSTSHYNHDSWDNTYAIDFAMPLNTKILAPASGEVVCLYDEKHKGGEVCGYKSNYGCIGGGRVMVVKDKKGNYLTFLHLQSFNKEVGDLVDKGDILAYSGGSKGVSGTCYNNGYGYHLHFHLWSGYKTPDSHTIPFTSNTKLRVKVDGQIKFLYGNSLNNNKIYHKQFTSLQ
jgi:lysozyme